MTTIDSHTAVLDLPVWEQTCVRKPLPHFIGRVEADVAIIGGGLTGLSAALHLVRARPDWSVVLLEAERIGAGASGRSTGIAGPGVGRSITSLHRRFGPEIARRMFRYSQDAVDSVAGLVSGEGIECDLAPSSHLLCATTRTQAARLTRQHQLFAALSLPVPLIAQEDLAHRLGHETYLRALEYQPAMLVNPLKLTLGLAKAATMAGVRVAEESRVTELAAERGRITVRVGVSGLVRARMAILATDGYTTTQLPNGRRVVPVRTHVLATRPLTAGERAELRWSGREAVIDQRTFFSYYRFDGDGRLLFGGGPVCVANAGSRASQRVWCRLEGELAALFPALRGVPIEHRWSGLTSVTIDDLPVVGQVPGKPGIWFAGAWRGHGVALSIANGAWLANSLTDGAAEAKLPWHRSHTRNPRLGPLQPTFVKSYVSALDAIDRAGALTERLRARRSAPRQPVEVRAR